jgi:hypothetical protein
MVKRTLKPLFASLQLQVAVGGELLMDTRLDEVPSLAWEVKIARTDPVQ